MKARMIVRLPAALFVAALALLISSGTALAHGHVEVGKYELVIGFRNEPAIQSAISMFNGPLALPRYQETSRGAYYWGSWAYNVGPVLDREPGITTEQIRACQLARRWCWQERLADGAFLVWPVPASEPVLAGEPQPPGTTTLTLPGGMTMPVFDPIKAGRKALDSPRLKAAYIAAKTARF